MEQLCNKCKHFPRVGGQDCHHCTARPNCIILSDPCGNKFYLDSATNSYEYFSTLPTKSTPSNPNMCSKCNVNPKNPGRSWCQMCFSGSTNSSTPITKSTPSNPNMCSKCNVNPKNPGRSWCQICFSGFTNSSTPITKSTPSNPNMCSKCNVNPKNPGRSWCQMCFSGSTNSSTVSTPSNPNMCSKCNVNPKNPGRSWCQTCFSGSTNSSTSTTKSTPSNPNMCSKCNVNPKNPGRSWCQMCYIPTKPVSSNTIELQPCPADKAPGIRKQFDEGMQKKHAAGTIIAIYKVVHKQRYDDYLVYQKQIQQKRNCADKKGNERRWWHGSTLGCSLEQTKTVCNLNTCAICGILTKGFLIRYAGSKTGGFGFANGGRFGSGLYFAPAAAKSHDYTKQNGNGVKCLILCKITCGNAWITHDNQTHLTAPPQGYDSVLGEVGKVLNHAEMVLYNEEAVLPAYVVFYK